MSNPLLPINDAMRITDDAFQVTRECAGIGYAPAVVRTMFDPPDAVHADFLIAVAKSELDDLMVLSMVATFEAHLKEYLRSRLHVTAGPYLPKVRKWIDGEIDFSNLSVIFKLFQPTVSPSLLTDLEAIRRYRNWVAHGRVHAKQPSRIITPLLAYNTLTHFMSVTGLI